MAETPPGGGPVRRRRDLRWIAVGVLAVCLGGLGAALLYANLSNAQSVLTVKRTVYRDQVITAGDLGVTSAVPAAGVESVPADQFDRIVGQTARYDLTEGSLLSPRAFGEPLVELGQRPARATAVCRPLAIGTNAAGHRGAAGAGGPGRRRTAGGRERRGPDRDARGRAAGWRVGGGRECRGRRGRTGRPARRRRSAGAGAATGGRAMSVLLLTSAGHSPGVTALGVALALTWPESVLLVDANREPDQTRAGRAPPGRRPWRTGAGRAAAGAPRAASPHRLPGGAHPAVGRRGRSACFLPGFSHPGMVALFDPVWPDLASALATTGRDVLVDAGRITPAGLAAGAGRRERRGRGGHRQPPGRPGRAAAVPAAGGGSSR